MVLSATERFPREGSGVNLNRRVLLYTTLLIFHQYTQGFFTWQAFQVKLDGHIRRGQRNQAENSFTTAAPQHGRGQTSLLYLRLFTGRLLDHTYFHSPKEYIVVSFRRTCYPSRANNRTHTTLGVESHIFGRIDGHNMDVNFVLSWPSSMLMFSIALHWLTISTV